MGEGTPADKQVHHVRAGGHGANRRFAFGKAVLDERSLELWVDGQRVALERKPLEVLLYLLRHSGEVVTKDELAENVWPGRFLSDSVLAGCVKKIRSVLGDRDHELIKTAHGFGYRFAGDVRTEADTAPARPAFSFKPGETPPGRPQWRLVERLGTGGYAEAWLARHEKTGDARVFKFALDGSALTALKREITLYRLLHDSLGEAAAVVRIFEWNVEEPPYFLETEYLAARDLRSWAEAQEGLSQVPLAVRLDLTAQVAEALAAAHSVGVLHKDLKPGNVLIHAGPKPRIKLGDFGSGSVVDAGRLEALGITRLGFTSPLQPGDTGTPLYLAPEIIAGQPSTVRADVYALGVILYQMIVGDFTRPLAPGWELDVRDEILRDDVALSAAGNPERRLGDAAQLAERLRTLETRRAARGAEIAAQERAKRTRKLAEELRRMRVYAVALLLLAATAIGGGVLAYKARNEALTATETAKAISDFLTEDVLRVDPAVERPREASYESLLNRAAGQVDIRFKNDPEAAAKIHLLLGRRFHEMGQLETAKIQYEHAARLFTQLYGRAADATLLALDRLATIYGDAGRYGEAYAVYTELHDLWQPRGSSNALSLLMIRARAARVLAFSGEVIEAEKELRELLPALRAEPPVSVEARVLFEQWFGTLPRNDAEIADAVVGYASATLGGNVLAEFGEEYQEGESSTRESIAAFARAFGEESEQVALSELGLGYILATTGAHDEAEQRLKRAQTFYRNWLPPAHFYHGLPLLGLARLRLAQGRGAEATELIQQARNLCQTENCSRTATATYHWDMGRAYDQLGRISDAIEEFRSALPMYEQARGADHIATTRVRISLADTLRRSGSATEAATTLSAIKPAALSKVRPNHPAIADLRRLEGLLALEARDLPRARQALGESLSLLGTRLDANHWQVKRARRELALANGGPP